MTALWLLGWLPLANLVPPPVSCRSPQPAPPNVASWPAPLDRRVTLHAREISLRDALDQLAAAARVRLSYSSDLLPLDRWVCVSVDSLMLGDALTGLLEAVVTPVVIAADHVVLSPSAGSFAVAEAPVLLDRVIITGTASGASWRPSPVALDVLDGPDLSRRSVNTLGDAINEGSPGIWVWEQSPLSVLAEYGSIRGASSFGLSYPKVYIDGIQAANPLVVTHYIADAVDRIEVIRGPQGAALYGADAISGVTNIVTRHEATAPGEPRFRAQGGVGWARSDFSPAPTLGQDHRLTLLGGSNARSWSFNGQYGTTGEFIPGAHARRVALAANGRHVGTSTIVTGIARLFDQRTATSVSPILGRVLPDSLLRFAGHGAPQTATAYTLGATARMSPSDRWQHMFVAGADGYVLGGVPPQRTPIPSVDATALQQAYGAALRGTFRATTVARIAPATSPLAVNLTLAAEQSVLRERTDDQQQRDLRSRLPTGSLTGVVSWRGNTGVTGQINAAVADQLYLTAGARFEHDEGTGVDHSATLPMVGVSWVVGREAVSVKLRSAYGKGIRWPETAARQTMWESLHTVRIGPALAPEEQSGVEAGADLLVGNTLAVHLTRFDQTASGLIQRVTVLDSAGVPGPGGKRIGYQLQNVGRIANDGWEMEGSLRGGPLTLGAGLALVHSRVRQVAFGYGGDLRAGDRMLEVPARTMSFTAALSFTRWSASITASRAEDWINYDRLRLATEFAATTKPSRDFVGPELRRYWVTYPGLTHLRANAVLYLRPDLALSLTGENLLDRQTGEPDNITVLPGRSVAVGLKAAF